MPLRIAFDLDGVLADFSSAYDRISDRLFPESRLADPAKAATTETATAAANREAHRPGTPRAESAAAEDCRAPAPAGAGGDDVSGASDGPAPRGHPRVSREASARDVRSSPRRRHRIWKEIRSTPDFWLTLDPMDAAVVPRLHELAVSRRWETFFLTQRPATAGDTVQRQTQRWLVERGFSLPSVVVHGGSRGRLAAALELDFLVEDTVLHCVDVVSRSSTKAILVAPEVDAATEANAGRLGIEICRSPAASLDLLDAASAGRLTAFLRRARRAIRK